MKPPRNDPAVAESDDAVVLPPLPKPQPYTAQPVRPELFADADETAVANVGSDPRAWRAVDDDTPRDGTLIEVKDAAKDSDADMTAYALWRITRRRENGHWVVIGYWSNPMTREPIAILPRLWRMPEGFAMPGMVV